MSGPNDRAWEPKPLELPLEPPRRGPRPVRSWDVTDAEAETERSGEERAGSHVVVIDIA
jgi:hypothetical protein